MDKSWEELAIQATDILTIVYPEALKNRATTKVFYENGVMDMFSKHMKDMNKKLDE